MTTVSVPTPSMQAGAEQLLAEPSRWTHARRKRDGREFWIVRGRTGVYYTAEGGDGCTCPGYRRRGVCSHSVAATMKAAQQATRENPCELPVTVRPTRYDAIFPDIDA